MCSKSLRVAEKRLPKVRIAQKCCGDVWRRSKTKKKGGLGRARARASMRAVCTYYFKLARPAKSWSWPICPALAYAKSLACWCEMAPIYKLSRFLPNVALGSDTSDMQPLPLLETFQKLCEYAALQMTILTEVLNKLVSRIMSRSPSSHLLPPTLKLLRSSFTQNVVTALHC